MFCSLEFAILRGHYKSFYVRFLGSLGGNFLSLFHIYRLPVLNSDQCDKQGNAIHINVAY